MHPLRRTALCMLVLGALGIVQHDASAQLTPRTTTIKRPCRSLVPVVRYTFDDVMTDARGAGPAFVPGTVAPTFGAGRLGKALYFTHGASAVAPIKNVPSTFTASQWIFQQDVPEAKLERIESGCNLSRGGNEAVMAYMINMVTTNINGGAYNACPGEITLTKTLDISGVRVPSKLGAWTHVAMTYDGTVGRSYQDGKLAGTSSIKLEPGRGSPWRLGGGNAPKTYIGAIDDLRVYAGVLDAGQLADLAAGSEPTECTATDTRTR